MSPLFQGKPNLRLAVALTVTLALPFAARGQIAGESVNMVSGTGWPGGDPFLQRQNEPSIAVSSANPQHLLAGANDYRSVDLPAVVDGGTKMAADAWLGVFKSYDGGQTWKSYLLPGYPLDGSADSLSSAVRSPDPLVPFNAAADPVVRAGTDGMFYFGGIVFARGTNKGRVVLNRFIDLNNKENGDPLTGTDSIRWVDAKVIDEGGAFFADKPWIAVDVPRAGATTCHITRTDTNGNIDRSFPGGALYMVWSRIYSDAQADVMFSRSLDCGDTWSLPLKLNDATSLASQGAVASVDPRTGDVYVAWRRFAVPTASPPQDDAIFAARTFSKGRKFTRPRLLTSITPYDQGQAKLRFRTEALPTITSSVDPSGTQSWTHVAWAQRSALTGDSQIVVSLVPVKPPPPSNDEDDDPCDGWKIPAVPLDTTPITDDAGHAFTRGHQFMPQLTFSQGRIVAVYYDSRLDHTRNYYKPNLVCGLPGICNWGPDSRGRWYTEERGPLGERVPFGLDWPASERELDDTNVTQTRHTIEVRVAMATPATQPAFTSIALSRMPFGARGDEAIPPVVRPSAFGANPLTGFIDLIDSASPPNVLRLQDLQVNPPNLPMFKNGTTAFVGDYIDVQGTMFVQTATGWAFDSKFTPAPVFHAVWTSNQDVVPPGDGDWTHYTPVTSPALLQKSRVDGTTNTASCDPLLTGSRNQNIYTARITEGLFVTSPQNSKALSGFPRNFVVSAFNATGADRTFTFAFSLTQPPPPGVNAFFLGDDGGPATSVNVAIPAHSSASRTVVMSLGTGGANPATTTVNVTEVGGSLAGSVTLNPPGLTFALAEPDGGVPSIASGEVLTVRISAAHLSNANLSNANLSNANLSNAHLSNANLSNANLSNANLSNANLSNTTIDAAHLSNANLSNANLSNANLSNSTVANANLSNANLSNANLSNANLSNASVTDIDYTVTNTGNTTQAFDVRLLATEVTQPVQVLVSRTYTKPIADGCNLVEQPDNKLVVNAGVVNPDPATINAPSPLATFALAPGETIQVTLRSFSTVADARVLGTKLAPVVSPQGNPIAKATALVVTTDANLGQAKVGQPYQPLTLIAEGGTGLAWTIAGGSLPHGLALSLSGGTIQGTPTEAGRFTFTVQAAFTVPGTTPAVVELTQKDFALVVQAGTTTTSLSAPATAYYGDSLHPLVLTATVAPDATSTVGPGGAGPTGTVTFSVDGTTRPETAFVQADGTASVTLPSSGVGALPVGSHAITASYSGDGNWRASSSDPSAPTPVGIKVKTKLTLSTDPAAPVFGSPFTLVATLDPLPPGAPPTGTVRFYEGPSSLLPIGTGSVSGGVAYSQAFSASGGVHRYGATFTPGDANYDAASLIDQAVTVLPAQASVDLFAGNPNPSTYGEPVSFKTQVLWVGPGVVPGGIVNLFDGSASVGSGELDGWGYASIVTQPQALAAGSHTEMQARYVGSGNFSAAVSLSEVQEVIPVSSTSVVGSSSKLATSQAGQAVTFTCTVTPSIPAAGAPVGTVTFRDNGALPGVQGVPSATAAGAWTWTTSGLAAGVHPITCDFSGSRDFGARTSLALTQTVTSPATTTVLTASPNPVREDKLVTLTATVAGTGGTPGGTVTFLDGTKAIGTATLSLGKATISRKPGQEGVHSITAVYAGNASFAGSTSVAVALKVLEEYSCSAYKLPLLTGGTVSAPSRSGNFTFGTKVAVKWQFRKATGAYVSRATAVKSLEAVYDVLCNGKPAATATRIALFDPATGPAAGSTFTYDVAANQYNLGWATTGASRGCWDIVLTPDNGVPQVATILKLQ